MAQEVEAVVLQQRALGLNRYEIYAILQSQSPQPPSPSAIHRAFRRHGINRLSKPMAEEKRRIIKQTIGELGHADLHRLPHDIFLAPPAGDIHVVSVIDACSRLAWATLVAGKKALPVMFRTLAVLTPSTSATACNSPSCSPTTAPSSPAGRIPRSIPSRPCCANSAPSHQALPAANQRQGGTLLANPRRRPH